MKRLTSSSNYNINEINELFNELIYKLETMKDEENMNEIENYITKLEDIKYNLNNFY